MANLNMGWQRTSLPGIYSSGRSCRIRVRVADTRTGRLRERNRIVREVRLADAEVIRHALRAEIEREAKEPPRQRVEDFGRRWLKLKQAVIDAGTHARYESALEQHAFKRLGRLDLRELRITHIRAWINAEIGEVRNLRSARSCVPPIAQVQTEKRDS